MPQLPAKPRGVGPLLFALCAVFAGVALAAPARAAQVPDDFVDELVVGGLDAPVNFDRLPDGRILLVEQRTARLRLVVGDSLAAVDPVGTITDVETTGPEQGLLGVAIDHRWPARPYVYVYHSVASTPNLRLSRYTLTGDLDGTGDGTLVLDPDSRRDILADIPDDYPLHNGGTLLFGPDGRLYLSIGEDGIPCAAQDIHELRGKILRMNIDFVAAGPGPAPSYQSLAAAGNPWIDDWDPRAGIVWQRGLRNPFSYDLDPGTGAIVIGDVGSADFEEVDYVEGGGHNFGWPLYEGPRAFEFPCSYADSGTITPPAWWYQRTSPEVEASVMIGALYRRPAGAPYAFPFEYNGDVFAYDLYEGALRRLRWNATALELAPPVPGQPTLNAWATGFFFSTRMRVGPDGGLWYFQGGSELRRIRYVGPPVGVPAAPARAGIALAAFPVPSRGATTLEYRVPAPGPVSLRVVDAAGRRVRDLVPEAPTAPGTYRATWDGRREDGRRAPDGLYFGVLRCGGAEVTRRIVRLGG